MKISLIVAYAKTNKCIGNKNELPWGRNYPEDLKRFKQLTTNKIILMGKNTYESIGKPLPNRVNVVISTTLEPKEGILVFKSINSALEFSNSYIKNFNYNDEVFVIGGKQIYESFLKNNLVNKLYITEIKKNYEGDCFFSKIDLKNWSCVEMIYKQEYDFLTYEKNNNE